MILRAFCLNCWGLGYCVSKHREDRLRAIGIYLREVPHEFVFLQEVWKYKDYEFIRKSVESKLPFSIFFGGDYIGSGLCIFSCYPIRASNFIPFIVNGAFYNIYCADKYATKGIGYCRVDLEKNDEPNLKFNLVTTHTLVNLPKSLTYQAHHVVQALTLSDFINSIIESADLTILAGDLNSQYHELLTQLLLQSTTLTDTFHSAQTLIQNKDEPNKNCFTTCGTKYNTFSKKDSCGERIDYILYYVKPYLKEHIVVQSYTHPLPATINLESIRLPFSYSDHEAIEVTFFIDLNKILLIQNQYSLAQVIQRHNRNNEKSETTIEHLSSSSSLSTRAFSYCPPEPNIYLIALEYTDKYLYRANVSKWILLIVGSIIIVVTSMNKYTYFLVFGSVFLSMFGFSLILQSLVFSQEKEIFSRIKRHTIFQSVQSKVNQ